MILVTFDEAEQRAEACCGETERAEHATTTAPAARRRRRPGRRGACSRPASRPARCRSPPTTTTRCCAGWRTTSASRTSPTPAPAAVGSFGAGHPQPAGLLAGGGPCGPPPQGPGRPQNGVPLPPLRRPAALPGGDDDPICRADAGDRRARRSERSAPAARTGAPGRRRRCRRSATRQRRRSGSSGVPLAGPCRDRGRRAGRLGSRAVIEDLINVADFERVAAEKLEPGVLGYFAGGAGDEATLRDNVAAWGRWQLRPRMLAGIERVERRAPRCSAPSSRCRSSSPRSPSSGWSTPRARWRWRAPRRRPARRCASRPWRRRCPARSRGRRPAATTGSSSTASATRG